MVRFRLEAMLPAPRRVVAAERHDFKWNVTGTLTRGKRDYRLSRLMPHPHFFDPTGKSVNCCPPHLQKISHCTANPNQQYIVRVCGIGAASLPNAWLFEIRI
jgi:hypothetical protein